MVFQEHTRRLRPIRRKEKEIESQPENTNQVEVTQVIRGKRKSCMVIKIISSIIGLIGYQIRDGYSLVRQSCYQLSYFG